MKNKNKWLLLLGILCFFGAIIIFIAFQFSTDYCNYCDKKASYLSTSGYAAELGIAHFSYDDFSKKHGKPEAVQHWFDPESSDRELELDSYPSFDVLYLVEQRERGERDLMFLQVVIKSESIRFGKLKVGLGSTRELIRLAYLLDEELSQEEIVYESHDFPDVDQGFYGEHWWRILFSYDDAGKVDTIAYSIAPN